jgi:hypothetical protein
MENGLRHRSGGEASGHVQDVPDQPNVPAILATTGVVSPDAGCGVSCKFPRIDGFATFDPSAPIWFSRCRASSGRFMT